MSATAVKAAPSPLGRKIQPDTAKTLAVFLMIVTILYFGREVVLPITLALLLAFILAPLVNLLMRWHLGRVASVLLGVFFALGVIVAVGSVIGAQIATLTDDLPQYTKTIQTKVEKVKHYTTGRLSQWADKLGPQLKPEAAPAADQGQPGQSPTLVTQAPQQQPKETPFAIFSRYVSSILSPLATVGIVLIVTIFTLLQREDLRNRLIRLVGSDDLHHTTGAIDDGGRRLTRYFLALLTINTIFGIVVGVGLLLIGVPNPVLWGIISGLLRFVPYVGSPLSAVFPILLAAAIEPGWSMAIWTTAFYAVIELLTAQAVEPIVYGTHTGLSPFSVVVSAIFWSWLWGPVGLLLSTPLTLCLVVIGRHSRHLEFLDVMLGDRPPLTPVEAFHQRLLAGDPDEAQDQAETALKEISLSAYYDEVAVEGLRRAAADVRRNAVDREQLKDMKDAVDSLIAGLEAHEDKQPTVKEEDKQTILGDDDDGLRPHQDPQSLPDIGQRPTVLCIAGPGPFDHAATAMLAQLLDKHGIGARIVDHTEASRRHIGTLDVSGMAMACLCYLDPGESLASVRYLGQRLRHRLPKEAPLLIGFWPADDPELTAEKVSSHIGADHFAGCLQEAVNACVEAARKANP
ncbi:MAG TPA: AI-2E family transporter [Alphaproteobacteria bacterium]|jgi:predicted PurR-regulated permease PerM|nr:AI-2E family transporter [Alphaproteobacteria bacterium]